MIRKALALVAVAGMVGLLGLAAVSAQTTTGPMRSFSAASVAPGGGFDVTITDIIGAGRVTETLPAGFSYVDGSATSAQGGVRARLDGQDVAFTLVGPSSFTYKVTASATGGSYSFSGVFAVLGAGEQQVGGAASITVEAAAVIGPMRSFSAASVAPGGEFDVTISDIVGAGRVTETLPAGFSYVDGSATSAQGGVRASADGQDVAFTLVGPRSFTYKVTASATGGSYSFSGVFAVLGAGEQQVGGAASITVEAVAVIGPMRSFSAASVDPGGEFDVTITDIVGAGRVTETLPAGFSYVDGSATSAQGGVRASADGQDVAFTLLGWSNFTYKVTASATGGSYSFSGVFAVLGAGEQQVGGAASITVRGPSTGSGDDGGTFIVADPAPVFTDGLTTARSIDESAAAGDPVGDPVEADDTDAITYSLLGDADGALFAIDENSGQISVADDVVLDYETRSTYTVYAKATDTSGDSDTVTVTIMVTNVEEAGTVSLSTEQPEVGTELTATLTDPDGSVADITWLWESSPDQIDWTVISEATSETYTPTADDEGVYLRATASYSDGHGPSKSAQMASANAVPATPVLPPTGDFAPSGALLLALLMAGGLLLLAGSTLLVAQRRRAALRP